MIHFQNFIRHLSWSLCLVMPCSLQRLYWINPVTLLDWSNNPVLKLWQKLSMCWALPQYQFSVDPAEGSGVFWPVKIQDMSGYHLDTWPSINSPPSHANSDQKNFMIESDLLLVESDLAGRRVGWLRGGGDNWPFLKKKRIFWSFQTFLTVLCSKLQEKLKSNEFFTFIKCYTAFNWVWS